MGLSTHVAQVHKTVLGCVPEALPGRDDPTICANVFGMNNIPPDALKERRVKLGIVDEEPARYLPSCKQQKCSHCAVDSVLQPFKRSCSRFNKSILQVPPD